MLKTKSISSLLVLGAALGSASLVGCGGGGNSPVDSLTGPGRMVVTLNWDGATGRGAKQSGPQSGLKGRDAHLGGIPAAANTVTVLIQTATLQKVQSLTVTRPTDGSATSSVTIEHLPLRLLNVDVKSFAGDATGTALSESQFQQVITNGTTMQLAIDSASSVVQLSTDLAVKSLAPGQTVTVAAIAHDPHGSVVATSAAGLTWTSSDPTIVSVAGTTSGALTAHGMGTATITVTDKASGTSYSFPVTVMTLTVPADSVAMTTNASYTFGATVTGTTQIGVTWAVAETNGGTITANGAYTAPAAPGVYHLVAISALDPTRTATIAVTVTAPPAPPVVPTPPADPTPTPIAPVVPTPPTPIVTPNPISVSLPTAPVQLTANGTQAFAAAVAGTTQTGVTWSVVEANGGTVTANGLYTAPSTPGIYHIMAVSVADPTRSATVAVTVVPPAPGGLNLGIN